jgi:hypothetical protein
MNDSEISEIQSFPAAFPLNSDCELTKLRIKIVRPPSIWNTAELVVNNNGFQAEAEYRK